MNYYEHHLGDYAEATLHLSFVEDAAYSRCIRKYYATEQPLPVDVKAVQRLIAARTKEEREAVEAVLQEFFELREDGWHNARCDEEISRYQSGEPERQLRRANEQARLQKHRQERADLFAALHVVGQHPSYNVSMAQLRSLHNRYCNGTGNSLETPLETFHAVSHATGPATPATATHSQSPVPSPQSPVPDSGSNPDISSESESSHRLLAQSARAKTKRRERKNILNGHGEDFARIRAAYPRRAGGQRWQDAAHAYHARLQEGRSHDEILAGVERYAQHIRAKGDEGTQFVQQAATFLGTNRQFLEPWAAAPTKADQRLNTNLSAAAEFMRRTDKPQ